MTPRISDEDIEPATGSHGSVPRSYSGNTNMSKETVFSGLYVSDVWYKDGVEGEREKKEVRT